MHCLGKYPSQRVVLKLFVLKILKPFFRSHHFSEASESSSESWRPRLFNSFLFYSPLFFNPFTPTILIFLNSSYCLPNIAVADFLCSHLLSAWQCNYMNRRNDLLIIHASERVNRWTRKNHVRQTSSTNGVQNVLSLLNKQKVV